MLFGAKFGAVDDFRGTKELVYVKTCYMLASYLKFGMLSDSEGNDIELVRLCGACHKI
jgi:hypothetical protein